MGITFNATITTNSTCIQTPEPPAEQTAPPRSSPPTPSRTRSGPPVDKYAAPSSGQSSPPMAMPGDTSPYDQGRLDGQEEAYEDEENQALSRALDKSGKFGNHNGQLDFSELANFLGDTLQRLAKNPNDTDAQQRLAMGLQLAKAFLSGNMGAGDDPGVGSGGGQQCDAGGGQQCDAGDGTGGGQPYAGGGQGGGQPYAGGGQGGGQGGGANGAQGPGNGGNAGLSPYERGRLDGKKDVYQLEEDDALAKALDKSNQFGNQNGKLDLSELASFMGDCFSKLAKNPNDSVAKQRLDVGLQLVQDLFTGKYKEGSVRGATEPNVD